MWKIQVYMEKVVYGEGKEPGKEDELIHTLESSDKVVIAAFLRGLAESYDPKKHLRGID